MLVFNKRFLRKPIKFFIFDFLPLESLDTKKIVKITNKNTTLRKGSYKPYLTKSANISSQKTKLNRNKSGSSNSKSPITSFRYTINSTPVKDLIYNTSQKSSNQKSKKPTNNIRKLYQSQSTNSFNIKKVSRDFSSNRFKAKSNFNEFIKCR
jgi:hypothetical protein